MFFIFSRSRPWATSSSAPSGCNHCPAGPEIVSNAFEPPGGPKVSKTITFLIKTYMNFVPSRTSGFACQMHFFVVDTIHAIDSRRVEQYSAVKISLDVSYCRVFCWDNFYKRTQTLRLRDHKKKLQILNISLDVLHFWQLTRRLNSRNHYFYKRTHAFGKGVLKETLIIPC